MYITLSENEYISGIAGSSNAVNCIILGERVDLTASFNRTSGNVLNSGNSTLRQIQVDDNFSSIDQAKKNTILYQGTLSNSISQLLASGSSEKIIIASIKIVNISGVAVNGIKFYANGTTNEFLITGAITLAVNEYKNIDGCCPSVTVVNNVTGGGGSGAAPFETISMTDADISVSPNFGYLLLPSVVTSSRNVDTSAISSDGDYFEFYNFETTYGIFFTGQNVYESDGITAVGPLMAFTLYQIRNVQGTLYIIN